MFRQIIFSCVNNSISFPHPSSISLVYNMYAVSFLSSCSSSLGFFFGGGGGRGSVTACIIIIHPFIHHLDI